MDKYIELYTIIYPIDRATTSNGSQWKGLCPDPDHNDTNASFSFNTDDGTHYCHAGCIQGGAFDWAIYNGMDEKEARIYFANYKENGTYSKKMMSNQLVKEPPKVDGSKFMFDARNYLNQHPELIPEYWDVDIVKAWKCGYAEGNICYPRYEDGKLIGYKVGKKRQTIGLKCGVFPPKEIIDDYDPQKPLYIFEGEGDCLTGKSIGEQAISFTAGANSIPRRKDGSYDLKWLSKYKLIVICYDNDKAGRKGAIKLAKNISEMCQDIKIEIIRWHKDLPDGHDVSDAFKDDSAGTTFIDALRNVKVFDPNHKDREDHEDREDDDPEPKPQRTDFKVLNVGEFMNQDFGSTEYIIDNMVGEGQIAVFGGDTGTGKTWIGLSCGYSLASGVPLFGHFKTKKKKVLLVQFENENDDIRKRLELMKPYYVKKACNTDFMKDFLVVPMDVNMEIFVDNWKTIEETLIRTGYRDGVLIVDNMYTSTDKNIQDNNDCKELLKIIHHIRKTYNLTIILIAHSNKGVNELKDLHYDQLQGGKVFASMVSNITQIHDSTASVDVRVMKITKAGRSGKNELHNIPFKLHWSDDDYVFTKGVMIPNIALHFQNVKERWEIKLIRELADTFDFRSSDNFDRNKFRKNLPDKYQEWYERKIDRYLNKMQDWGLVEKTSQNNYRIKRNEIEEFDSK